MSFGRPGALGDTFKVLPPQRGSFPLDHDGELCASWRRQAGRRTATTRTRASSPHPILVATLTPGECKTFMLTYMRCLKANKNDAGACRPEARDYLGCRMDNELMGRDDWENLGLGDVGETSAKAAASTSSGGASASTSAAAATPSSGGEGRYVPSERI